MQVKITRIDESLPLPEYKTSGAVGFDLYARRQTRIAPGESVRIPSNVIIKTPPGYMLLLTARSSLSKKRGLMLANGVGVIDQDFCGPEDEIQIALINVGSETHIIERNERVVQAMLIKIERAEWEESEIEAPTRGGFGSTGRH